MSATSTGYVNDMARNRSAVVHHGGQGRGDERRGGDARHEAAVIAAGVIALLAAGVLVVILVAQNVGRVEFTFLWWTAEVSLAGLLLGTALVVAVADQVIVWWRRRREVREPTDRALATGAGAATTGPHSPAHSRR
jgi:uncharacterized integral membrane protein